MKNLILFLIIFSIFSCEYENMELINSENTTPKYLKDIVPILTLHCAMSGCHVNGAMTGDFTDYNQVKEKIILGKFQRMVFDLRLMPPIAYAKLSQDEIKILKRWIDGGYLED